MSRKFQNQGPKNNSVLNLAKKDYVLKLISSTNILRNEFPPQKLFNYSVLLVPLVFFELTVPFRQF